MWWASLVHKVRQAAQEHSFAQKWFSLQLTVSKGIHGDHPPVGVEFGTIVGDPTNPRILVNRILMHDKWHRTDNDFDYDNDIALLYLKDSALVTPAEYDIEYI